MSEQTFDLVQNIRKRIQATIHRTNLADLTFGLILSAGLLAGIWLLSIAIEAGFWLGTTPRTVLFWALVVASGSVLVYFLLLPLLRLIGWLRNPSEETVASRIGAHYPEISDRMVNLLQLSSGQRSGAPDAMVDGAVRMLGEQIQPVPFEQMETFGRARKITRFAFIPVLGVIVCLIAAPATFLSASQRLLSPGAYFAKPAPFQLLVEPGDTDLVKGESLSIVVRPAGNQLPRTLELSLNNTDEDVIDKIELSPDSTGAFRHTIINVRKSLRYQIKASPVTSQWYTAAITERPLVRGLQVSLTFPAYTGIPEQRLDPDVGDVTALPGTRVMVEAEVGGRNVEKGFLLFDDGSQDSLAINGAVASGLFVLRREGAYQVVLRNEQDVENGDRIVYSLALLSDAYPSVALLEPEPLTDLSESMQVGMRLRILDDFGFSGLKLFYRLAESRFSNPEEVFRSLALPLANPRQLDQEIIRNWSIAEETGLDPVPGDVIEYFVQVWDNDTVSGFKSARTDVQRLRFPSLAEQYREIEESQDEVESQMESLLQETESVQEQFQKLRDELRTKQDADWEDQRQFEQIQNRQEQMEAQVDELRRQIESVTQKMEENNLVSDETLEMYRELQKVVEEVNSPELRDALKKLQEAMESLNLQQLQQSLQEIEFNEQQYQQRLERTLDLFKKIRVQQGLEEAARRAEELARRQEQLAKETGKLMDEQAGKKPEEPAKQPEGKQGDPNENTNPESGEQNDDQGNKESNESTRDLAGEQEKAGEEMKALEQKMEEVRKQMEAARNMPEQKMENLSEQTRKQQLPEKMQENSRQLRQNDLQKAQQGQQQMQQTLQQLQQELQQMQQQMQGNQMQVNMAGLRRALDDILTLSQRQEGLRSDVRGLSPDSPQFRPYAQRQVELSEGLSVVSDSLQQLARQIPQMSRSIQQQTGEALQDMAMATDAMSERTAGQAGGHQKSAMMHLNELALLLSDLLNQMMNSQGSGGGMSLEQMLQQLQQMAGQQQQLNDQIQQMLNDAQGNRLSTNMEQRLQQMAAQQEAIQRQLKEIGRDPAARGKLLGDLEKIAEQMEESIQELQQSRAGRPLIERQRQILTRLLDAQRSMQERGQEKRRESRSGQDLLRESPADLSPSEKANKLRQDLLRALESGYAPDFEELIKRYFELLQEQPPAVE